MILSGNLISMLNNEPPLEIALNVLIETGAEAISSIIVVSLHVLLQVGYSLNNDIRMYAKRISFKQPNQNGLAI